MVNNQIEFNKEYPKEVKEIEIEYENFEEKRLVIEDYPNLEKLYLQNVESMEKITFKNLTQLQECTIWDCGMKELVIENCPNLEKLNIENNLLTNLGFIKNLKSLEELKIKGNDEIIKILKPYNGDWRRWKGLQIHNPKGSSYYIQNHKEKVESETSLKKEFELETQIEIPPKSKN